MRTEDELKKIRSEFGAEIKRLVSADVWTFQRDLLFSVKIDLMPVFTRFIYMDLNIKRALFFTLQVDQLKEKYPQLEYEDIFNLLKTALSKK